MKLRKLFLTKNACYKAGCTITPIGIMVHSTGVNNPYLRRYIGPDDGMLGKNTSNNHWNHNAPDERKVCVHGFIGKLNNGTVATYQTLPWKWRGWHCGGSGNDTHIGIEICEDGLNDVDYFSKVYQEAVELCAYLCRVFGLSKSNIICHSEGYKLGIASNHSDVMHWFSKHSKNMDMFRADVKILISATDPTRLKTYTYHNVIKGDSLWKISIKYLGDGSRYKDIMMLNGLKNNIINVGQKLKIPK